jgi:hypothetical protein
LASYFHSHDALHSHDPETALAIDERISLGFDVRHAATRTIDHVPKAKVVRVQFVLHDFVRGAPSLQRLPIGLISS